MANQFLTTLRTNSAMRLFFFAGMAFLVSIALYFVAPCNEAQAYVIKLNRALNTVTIYENDEVTPVKAMVASRGDQIQYTPLGTFTITDQYVWRDMLFGVYCQYASRIGRTSMLFHSIPYTIKYNKASMKVSYFNNLGNGASAGCVRLACIDAKWIYDNCDRGTKIVIYDNWNDPGPLGKPSYPWFNSPNYLDWDPTDPDPSNPYLGPTGVTITSGSSPQAFIGDGFQFTHALSLASDIPDSKRAVTWSSSDTSVVVIDSSSGWATAVGAGWTKITVTTVNGYSASCWFQVGPHAESAKMSSMEIQRNRSMTFAPDVCPDNALVKTFTTSSSNPSVATITSSGAKNYHRILAKAVGTSSVSVKLTDGGFTTAGMISVYDYTVIHKNWDGTVLKTQHIAYGDIASTPAAPTRASDSTNDYSFKGWDKEYDASTHTLTVTATYNQKAKIVTSDVSSDTLSEPEDNASSQGEALSQDDVAKESQESNAAPSGLDNGSDPQSPEENSLNVSENSNSNADLTDENNKTDGADTPTDISAKADKQPAGQSREGLTDKQPASQSQEGLDDIQAGDDSAKADAQTKDENSVVEDALETSLPATTDNSSESLDAQDSQEHATQSDEAILSLSNKKAIQVAGVDRYDTSKHIALSAFRNGSKHAVIAVGEDFPDALAASALAGQMNAPILLTDTEELSWDTYFALYALDVTSVTIVGGTGVVSQGVEAQLNKFLTANCDAGEKASVVRYQGEGRIETAEAIFSKALAGKCSRTAIITTGADFADGVSIASFAFKTKSPIFLTDSNGLLEADSYKYFVRANFDRVIIVGGTGVVSQKVEDNLKPYFTVKRLGGNDRYLTSKAIALWTESEGLNWNEVGIATGLDFPDALTSSTLFGQSSSVMLLMDASDSGATSLSTLIEKKSTIKRLIWAGGTGVVTPTVREQILSALGW